MKKNIYIFLLLSVNCILLQGSSTRLALAIWMIPTHSLFFLLQLCLVAYVNLTFMSCKTELSLINHLVLSSCLVLKYRQLFFLWATHFGERALKTLLESNVLNCCLKITKTDLRKIGLKMRELRFRELGS